MLGKIKNTYENLKSYIMCKTLYKEFDFNFLYKNDVDIKLSMEYLDEWNLFRLKFKDLTSTEVGDGGVNIGDMQALYSLIRLLKPKRILEIGTHLGFSTSVIGGAIKDSYLDSTEVTTVDLVDVNCEERQHWRNHGSIISPINLYHSISGNKNINYIVSKSVDFLQTTNEKFDFIFLDGDHSAPTVLQELYYLQRCALVNCFVVLHDFFPSGKPLWKGKRPITGPYNAIKLINSATKSRCLVQTMSPLPWPTKHNSKNTSLAYLRNC